MAMQQKIAHIEQERTNVQDYQHRHLLEALEVCDLVVRKVQVLQFRPTKHTWSVTGPQFCGEDVSRGLAMQHGPGSTNLAT